jgi:hypothetical protein
MPTGDAPTDRRRDLHRLRSEGLLIGGLTVLFMAVGAALAVITSALR